MVPSPDEISCCPHLLGVLIVVVAINGLVILMVPVYLTDMIKGIILLLAIMLFGAVSKFTGGK
jgi:ribose/xylose/arabinose/galactoside ABC-type transport system permease subunit